MASETIVTPTATRITDKNATLVPDHKYLMVFDLPAWIPVDILRKLSDGTNMVDTFIAQYGYNSHVSLLGTTIAANAGAEGQPQLHALIKVNGTPLLAALTPVVAIVLIVAGVYLAVQFKHAIDVTAQAVAVTVTTAGKDAGEAVKKIADAVESLSESAGTTLEETGKGLQYALPILAVAIVGGAAIWLVGFRKAVA